MNNQIIITGANGFLGSYLTTFFSEKGFKVIALVRSIPNEKLPSVLYKHYQMNQTEDFDFFDENSILIHCAYVKKQLLIENEDINIFAAKHLIAQAKKNKIWQCVFVSSFSVAQNTDTYYVNQKQKVEEIFKAYNHLIVRPSLLIGNGGLFENSIKTVKKFKVLPVIQGGNQPIYYVSVQDFASVLQTCLVNNIKGTLLVSNENYIYYKEFYSTIAKRKGFTFFKIFIPLPLLKLIVFLNSFLPKPFFTKDNLKGLTQIKTISIPNPLEFQYENLDEILESLK